MNDEIEVPRAAPPKLNAETDAAKALKARNRRNLAIALALLAFVVLVFISTIVHLGGGATPQP